MKKFINKQFYSFFKLSFALILNNLYPIPILKHNNRKQQLVSNLMGNNERIRYRLVINFPTNDFIIHVNYCNQLITSSYFFAIVIDSVCIWPWSAGNYIAIVAWIADEIFCQPGKLLLFCLWAAYSIYQRSST